MILVGAALLAAGFAVYQWNYGIQADYVIQALIAAGLLFGVLGLLTVFARTDVVAPYAQALRIMAKNSMLWVMFLACMATSVFFSFDSRFNVVFPQEQRQRVSELRATNQVSGIIADIGATIADQQLTQTSSLFQSEGWHAYESQLDKLAAAAQGSTGEIEKYFNDQIEARNRGIKEQQERITTAQSGQAGIAGKKTSLTDELARLEGDRATLAADYSATKTGARHARQGHRRQARRGHGREQGRRRYAEGGPRPGLSPDHGRPRQDAGGLQDPGRPREGRQEASRHGGNAHLADQARAGDDRRRARQVQGRGRDRRAAHQAWRRRTSPGRTPSSASIPAACCRPSKRRAPSSASIPTRSASPRCSSAARSSTAPCSPPT